MTQHARRLRVSIPASIADVASQGAGGAGPAIDTGLIIYRPGGTTGGNVFADPTAPGFAAACAAIVALPGAPRTLYFDLSFVGGSFVMPAGTFNHGPGVDWVIGPLVNTATEPTLHFDNGTGFGANNPRSISSTTRAHLSIGQGAAPFVYPGVQNLLFFSNLIVDTPGGPIVSLTGPPLSVLFVSASPCDFAGPGPAFDKAAGTTIFVTASPQSDFANSMGSGPGLVRLQCFSAAIAVGNNATQPNTVVDFFASAARMLYAAKTIGDWSGTNPVNVADALDRIAAHVGPIP